MDHRYRSLLCDDLGGPRMRLDESRGGKTENVLSYPDMHLRIVPNGPPDEIDRLIADLGKPLHLIVRELAIDVTRPRLKWDRG